LKTRNAVASPSSTGQLGGKDWVEEVEGRKGTEIKGRKRRDFYMVVKYAIAGLGTELKANQSVRLSEGGFPKSLKTEKEESRGRLSLEGKRDGTGGNFRKFKLMRHRLT